MLLDWGRIALFHYFFSSFCIIIFFSFIHLLFYLFLQDNKIFHHSCSFWIFYVIQFCFLLLLVSVMYSPIFVVERIFSKNLYQSTSTYVNLIFTQITGRLKNSTDVPYLTDLTSIMTSTLNPKNPDENP